MTRLLLIVAKDQLDLLEYWKRWFSGVPTVEVVLDRRQGERRQRAEMAEPGQRRRDRRQQPIDEELRATGFEIIRSSA